MLVVIVILVALAVYAFARFHFERKLAENQQVLTNEFHQHMAQKDSEHHQYVVTVTDQFTEKYQILKDTLYAKLADKEKEFIVKEKEHRTDAVKRSRQVVSGQVYEQISPLVPGFPYALKDTRHVGNPLDFLIFNGLNDPNYDLEIVFLEIKSGSSTLNANERRVREAVQSGRVRYDVFHPDAQQDVSNELADSLQAQFTEPIASVLPFKSERPVLDEDGLPPSADIRSPTVIDSNNSSILETLTCTHCNKPFERALTPGRKPLFCPRCRGTAS